MKTLKIVVNGADLAPVAPSLQTLEEVRLEQAIESIRRSRVETERAEEAVKEFGFRRVVLVVVLCILGLVALGSLAVVVFGIVGGQGPVAAGAAAPLAGSGGFSVLVWRTYMGSAPDS
jgi:cytochrome c-type biogenesis protein CcmH/NrfG